MTSGSAVLTAAVSLPMAWTNERLKLSCADGIGFKSLWKMLVLDKRNGGRGAKSNNNETYLNNSAQKNAASSIADLLERRRGENAAAARAKNNMSLLKCLAINALELSAPASPLLLLQPPPHQDDAYSNDGGSTTQTTSSTSSSSSSSSTSSASLSSTSLPPSPPPPPCGWLQLAGHPESIAPAANGTVRKRISGPDDSEAIAYRGLSADPHAVHLIPQFHGCHRSTSDDDDPGAFYLELQNLLHGFHNPAVMDIKMGRRTFLESEVTNDTLRPDLYSKMAAVEATAPTAVEHQQAAITKLRYMLFREQLSSSQHHGFRVEALKQRHQRPVTDLKTMKCGTQVDDTLERFVADQPDVTGELIERLRTMRALIERSAFFAEHEVVGSSVFIVYDGFRVGAWLIDFAKCRRLPAGVKVDHRRAWVPGNHEEGLLHGFDELIGVMERIRGRQRLLRGPHGEVRMDTQAEMEGNKCSEDCRSVRQQQVDGCEVEDEGGKRAEAMQ